MMQLFLRGLVSTDLGEISHPAAPTLTFTGFKAHAAYMTAAMVCVAHYCLDISSLFPPPAPPTVVTGWVLMSNKQMAFLCHTASCRVPAMTQWCILSGKQHELAALKCINITPTENEANKCCQQVVLRM